MVRAFNNSDAYVKISAYGGLVAMLGGVLVSILFPQLRASMGTTASGWTKMILMFAIPGILVGVIRFLTIKEKYSLDIKTEHTTIKDILHALKENKFIYIIAFIRMTLLIRFYFNRILIFLIFRILQTNTIIIQLCLRIQFYF